MVNDTHTRRRRLLNYWIAKQLMVRRLLYTMFHCWIAKQLVVRCLSVCVIVGLRCQLIWREQTRGSFVSKLTAFICRQDITLACRPPLATSQVRVANRCAVITLACRPPLATSQVRVANRCAVITCVTLLLKFAVDLIPMWRQDHFSTSLSITI